MTLATNPAASGSFAGREMTLLALSVVALALVHCMLGSKFIPPGTVIEALISPDRKNFDHRVVLTLRLPRVMAMILAGAALGAAGVLLQGILRNRLGEPQILGLNAGASLAIVLLTTVPGLALPGIAHPLAASMGGAILFALVLGIASAGREGATPAKLIFCGIAFSTLAGAITSALLILDEESLQELRFWLTGDGAGVAWSTVRAAAPVMLVGAVLAIATTPGLDALQLGDAVARGLGANVARTRALAVIAAALLSGAAVSLVGPIEFVGLIAPALWRRDRMASHRHGLPIATLGGAALLLAADIVAIRLLAPRELPTGAMTGLVGAPVFLYLVARTIR